MKRCPTCGRPMPKPRKSSEADKVARKRNAKLGGRKRKVTWTKLKALFDQREIRTAGAFQMAIKNSFGVTYDRSHVAKILQKLKQPGLFLMKKFILSKEYTDLLARPNRKIE